MVYAIRGWATKQRTAANNFINIVATASLVFASTLGMTVPAIASDHGGGGSDKYLEIQGIDFYEDSEATTLITENVEAGKTVYAKVTVILEGKNWQAIDGSNLECINDFDYKHNNSDGVETVIVPFIAPENNTADSSVEIEFSVYSSNSCQPNNSEDVKSSPLAITPALSEYIVTFKDYDGSVIEESTIEEGQDATPPSNPERSGYTFAGWDREFTNVTENIVVTAQYQEDETAPTEVSTPTNLAISIGSSEELVKCEENDDVIFTNTRNITLHWDSSDSDNVVDYIYYNRQHLDEGSDGESLGDVNSRSVNITPDKHPEYYYAISAVDNNGNESDKAKTCNIILDLEDPEIEITSVSKNPIAGEVTIVGTASDNEGLRPLRISFRPITDDGVQGVVKTFILDMNVDYDVDTNKEWTLTFDTTDYPELTDGDYRIVARANDLTGTHYSNSNTAHDTLDVTIDNNPPVVNIGPDQEVTGISTFLTATADDETTSVVKYEWEQESGPTGGDTTFDPAGAANTEATINGVYGTYIYKFAATDAAGNSAFSIVSVTYTEPSSQTRQSTQEVLASIDNPSPSSPEILPSFASTTTGFNDASGTSNDDATEEDNEGETLGTALQEGNGDLGGEVAAETDETFFSWWWLLLLALLGSVAYIIWRRRQGPQTL